MKTCLLYLNLCLAVATACNAVPRTDEPSGIKFFTGSWKDVLAEAKRQNKPVFVDMYTTWCGPCKLMAKQAFPDAKVGEKFNANFVSYQIDAEKGEGITLAKKYAVDAYPTSLYVSGDGELIHRAIGYGGISGMLDEADKAIAMAKDPNPLSVMEKQYESGKRDTEFLSAYLQKRAAVGMPNGEALDAYLKVVPETEWSSDKNVELIAGNITSPRSSAFNFLLQQAPLLFKSQQEQDRQLGHKARMNLFAATNNVFKGAVKTKSESQLEEFMIYNQQVYSALRNESPDAPTAESQANGYRMRFYQQTKNFDKYRTLATAEATKLMAVSIDSVRAKNDIAYKQFQAQTAMMPDSVKNQDDFKKYAESMKQVETGQMAMQLNSLAWTYYESMTDAKDLKQALTWSAKSLDYDRSGMYLDTYAHLLSKLGRKAEAIKTQQEAIAKIKAAGEDTADYEKGLAEMKKQ